MAPYKVVKQGYLQLAPLAGKKLQQQRKKWRRYWFILIEDPQQVGLVCFLTEKDFIARSKHKGFIRLDDSEALNVLKDQQPCYNNSLEIIKKGARYVLGAETRYEMHEWLLAIHQTVDEFKTKQVGTSVATQTAESSLETDGMAVRSTQKGREESSSPSGPASSNSSVDDSVQIEHFDGPMSQNGHAAHEVQTVHLSMKEWGSTEMLRKEEEEEEEEQGRERGSTQIKRRSLLSGQGKRSSRHISPPRDPPPPPPNDVVDPPEPSSDSDLPSNDVSEAMDQAFGQMDGNVPASVPRRRRRPHSAVHLGTSMEDIGEHFSTFKPDSLSQPNDTASAFRKNPNLPSLGRRWKVIGEGTTAKMKPIETPTPQVPHTYQEAQTEEAAADPVAVSVYSDDFVEHHHSLKRSHRRKMSAPANLLLDEPMDTDPLPYPPMRQQRSYGDLHSILPKPLDLAPPLPPRTPTNLKPEVNIAENEAAMPNIRQSSLRKMVSKDFLSHLTSVIPFQHQQQQQKKESEGKQQSSARENGHSAPPVKDVEEHPAAGKNSYEPVVDKEMTKVSINEIKKRLFGDRSNLVTSPISHLKPTIQAQSPVADTPVRPPEPSKTRLQSEDSELDEPHTPIPYTREVPTPSIARNPNYGEQSQNRGRGNPNRSDLRPQSALLGQSWQNGYAPRVSREHTPSQPYDRNAWVSSSQSINDFRFHDVTHLHRGIRPIPRLQQDHRATSSSVLQRMSQLKGRITSLDSNFAVTNLPQKVGRYRGSSPRTEGQAHYSPKASPPGEETSRAPKPTWPYIRGSGQNRRQSTRSQSHPAGRDTPSRMALNVFDTMVEWDEKSNTTILRSTC